MSTALYDFGGLRFWTEREIMLTEQAIAVLLGRIGKLLDEGFDLLASSVFESFGAAEIDGVGFDQFGIKFVLADDLTEPVAYLVTGTIAVRTGTIGRELR